MTLAQRIEQTYREQQRGDAEELLVGIHEALDSVARGIDLDKAAIQQALDFVERMQQWARANNRTMGVGSMERRAGEVAATLRSRLPGYGQETLFPPPVVSKA